MSVLDRIRANGGDAYREGFTIKLRRGRLSDEAVAWLQLPEVKVRVHREVWPQVSDWHERAAIREFDGGQDRASAERDAYAEVMG